MMTKFKNIHQRRNLFFNIHNVSIIPSINLHFTVKTEKFMLRTSLSGKDKKQWPIIPEISERESGGRIPDIYT